MNTMRKNRVMAILLAAGLLAGCPMAGPPAPPEPAAPFVLSTTPADLAAGVATDGNITAVFSEEMDDATVTDVTFTLTQGAAPVPAGVTYTGLVATLNPISDLTVSTLYTATITTGAMDRDGIALAVEKTWSFTTRAPLGPAEVNLGTAGNYVILAKAGISTVPGSVVTGDIGVSPAAATYITGFSLVLSASNVFATSGQITGRVYAADYAVPTPANLTMAVGDMQTAYTDAAGRSLPDFTELGAGDISGLTLVPGLYKWGTGVLVSTDVTLAGGPADVWIFQIAQGMTVAAGARIRLSGGALARNVFWQAAGAVVLDTTAHLEGIVLSQTQITLATGATVNGRLLSQTAVTLDQNTVTQTAP